MSVAIKWIGDGMNLRQGQIVLSLQFGTMEIPVAFPQTKTRPRQESGSRKKKKVQLSQKSGRVQQLIQLIAPGFQDDTNFLAINIQSLIGGDEGLRSLACQRKAMKNIHKEVEQALVPKAKEFLQNILQCFLFHGFPFSADADPMAILELAFALPRESEYLKGRMFSGRYLLVAEDAQVFRLELGGFFHVVDIDIVLQPLTPVVYGRQMPSDAHLCFEMVSVAATLDGLRVYKDGYFHCSQCFAQICHRCLCVAVFEHFCIRAGTQEIFAFEQIPLVVHETKVNQDMYMSPQLRFEWALQGHLVIGVY